MRRCAQCGIIKPVDQFPPRKDRSSGRMSRCHECDRKRSAERYAAARLLAVEIYGGRCSECGATDRLEFDHIENDGGDHRRAESQPRMIRRIAKLGRAIDDHRIHLLCQDCHRGPGRMGCGRSAHRRLISPPSST